MSLELALAALRQANRIDGTRASYRKDAPGEYQAVMAYLDGGPKPTGQLTFMGQGLVGVEEHRRSQTAPPPPPGNKLPNRPPALSSPVNFTMTNANRNTFALINGGDRDLAITIAEALNGPISQIGGGGGGPWRNVVITAGGKLTDLGPGDRYGLPIAATGTVHLEGLDIRIDGDAVMSRGGSPACIWQFQNCRFETHFNGGSAEHSDCFQFQGGTKMDKLRFYNCTMLTDYQGFMLRFPDAAAFMNSGDFKRLNFRRRPGMGDPAQAYLFIPDEDPATGHGPGQRQIGPIAMTDVWMEHNTSSTHNLYPDKIFSDAFSSSGNFGNRYGVFQESDSIGPYYRASTPSDVVPPGGSASGQACLGPKYTGIIRVGVPPGGDFCPAGVAGVGYQSPGYV